MQADVVVIGSGAGGAAAAGQLQRAGATVILVEAGGQVAPGPGWHGRNAFPAEHELPRFADFMQHTLSPFAGSEPAPRELPGTVVAHALGGLMVTWTHNCPSPHPLLEPVAGVATASLEQALARARRLLSVSSAITDGGVRQTRLLQRARELYPKARRQAEAMPLAARFEDDGHIRYTAAGDLLAADHKNQPHQLTILAERVAQSLGHRDGHVTHVDVAPRDGGEVARVYADRFVLAAGAIGTPKLLIASEIDTGPALGRYLTDHMHISSSVVLSDQLRASVPDDDPTVGVLIPVDDDHLMQSEIVKFPVAVSELRAEHNALHRVDVFTTVGVKPTAENRLTFDPDRLDAFGLPHFDACFRLSTEDQARMRDATSEHVRVLQGIADSQDGWGINLLRAGESTHLMGTHRIGERDDGESVVDPIGRLWRSDNLWLAGNGLLNRWTACNPSLTTIALGLRTADAIRSDAG